MYKQSNNNNIALFLHMWFL